MKYDWSNAGEEWSQPWGNSEAQWRYTILPRIAPYLPAKTILEIAPGFGRWTHFLRDYCRQLWVVDRAADCIEACRRRFASDARVRCFANDGHSLSMIPDNSVDFVFSFDSFVHMQPDIVEAYLREFAKKLKLGGSGFVHHSNLAQYSNSARRFLPRACKNRLIKMKILDWEHHRNPDMSSELFGDLCKRYALHCVTQEL
ncbi:MAG: class I SAM-dependent methyltransferase, partial [Verrucomicrobia bacterium]|nr:class I SAM-dependent methyltransferase [Verrucomicrobiota bacterium]